MEKWSYKYSFISGILFITSFFLKEILTYSKETTSFVVFILPFVLMIFYLIALFLGYLKYSILNDLPILKISTKAIIFIYPFIVLIELVDNIFHFSNISTMFIVIPNIALSLSVLFFTFNLMLRKKIYGKNTIFQGIISILFSLSIILSLVLPIVEISKLPLFLLMFISLTYLINKRVKKNKKEEIRLL